MISNISSTVGIVCLVQVRKLGRVDCVTLKGKKKNLFYFRSKKYFLRDGKEVDYQERENEVGTL